MTGPIPGSDAHRRIMTASKAAAVLGLSPWRTPLELWHEMRGTGEPQPTNNAMRRGHYLEPAILAWWRDQHPEVTDYAEQVWMPLGDWAGCTVDAAGTTGASVIVEAKSTASWKGWGKPGTDAIPPYYMAQVSFQLALTGADRCYVAAIGPYLDFREYVVLSVPDAEAKVLAACKRFYDSLADDEPPTFITERKAAA